MNNSETIYSLRGSLHCLLGLLLMGCLPSYGARVEAGAKLKASAVFHKLSYLPANYLEDGCYARAYYVAVELAAVGLDSQLQYVVPKSGKIHYRNIEWDYHVAVMSWYLPDSEPTIYDPALNNHPISRSDWTRALKTDSGHEFYWVDSSEFGGASRTKENVGPEVYSDFVNKSAKQGNFKLSDFVYACRELHREIDLDYQLSDIEREAKVKLLVKRSRELLKLLKTSGKMDIPEFEDISMSECE